MRPSTRRAVARAALGPTTGSRRWAETPIERALLGTKVSEREYEKLRESHRAPSVPSTSATALHRQASAAWRRQLEELVNEGAWSAVAKTLGVPVGTLAAPGALTARLDELGVETAPSWWDRFSASMVFEERYNDRGVMLSRSRTEPDGVAWLQVSDRLRREVTDLIAEGDVLAATKLLDLPASSAATPERFIVELADRGIDIDETTTFWERIKEATTTTIRASDIPEWHTEPVSESRREAGDRRDEASAEARSDRPVWPAPRGFGLVEFSKRFVRNVDDEAVAEQIRDTSDEVLARWGTKAPTEHVDAETEVRVQVSDMARRGDLRFATVEDIANAVLGSGRRAEALAAEIYEQHVEDLTENEARSEARR